jgi:hypothetical protein
MAPGEQPVISRVTLGDGRQWTTGVLNEEEPPQYKEEGQRRLVELHRPDEDECGSSSEEEGRSDDQRRRYPSYPKYVTPWEQVNLSDTKFKLSAKTTRTTKIFGVPVMKRTVEATDEQDWQGH